MDVLFAVLVIGFGVIAFFTYGILDTLTTVGGRIAGTLDEIQKTLSDDLSKLLENVERRGDELSRDLGFTRSGDFRDDLKLRLLRIEDAIERVEKRLR